MRIKDGAAFRRARERAQYSQCGLARAVRTSQTTIWKLEHEQIGSISVDLGELLALRLDRDVEDLFIVESDEHRSKVTTVRARNATITKRAPQRRSRTAVKEVA